MNLKDADELLVTSRIWTEQAQIDHRLLDLTEHMENVIQTYLRNEYASIEEYNVMAGEVAEPYRVLVVANYPANFSDTAQRRLVSIAQSGPRCGVYVLVSLDTKLQNATNQLAKDLEPNCVNLAWKDEPVHLEGQPVRAIPAPARRPARGLEAEPDRQARRRGRQGRQARRGPLRGHRPARPTSTGPGTAGASSTSRSAAPGPPSSRTSSSARAPRSTCSSPARPARVSRRCCTP